MRYCKEGADELVFLDITATVEKRKTLVELVKKLCSSYQYSFYSWWRNYSGIEDVNVLLQHGADKISVNTAAFKNRQLINDLANEFGSQCIVLAIDTKQEADGKWYVYLNGGRIKTDITAFDWAKQAVELGAGEILLTSMNNDGTKDGFAEDITLLLSKELSVPIIASGGAGNMQHFADVFQNADADAALAASVFHYKEIEIPALKQFLFDKKVNVRL